MKSLPPLQVILPSKSPTLPEELTPSICPTLLEILGIKLIMRDHDDLNIPIDHQPLTIDHRHGSEITTTHRPLCYPRVHRPFLLRQNISGSVELETFAQAKKAPKWQEAMHFEIQALEENNTWSLTPLPASKKPIGCKWLYKIKYKSDGRIECYKAHLVAKGYAQIEGVHYNEIFPPVAKLVIVCCLLAIAATKGWYLYQMDVQNAFLHGDLDEEAYMLPPLGYS
ncbi:Retrovirus-related Pol polyprotein from transposon RE2 [Vitis vinifera]|uniref:Retrovirus-related Pol polyprotein from transposon RE2 n=1 Tax=Vitis vinifera TaxID=29760 RepID=A0A438BYU3_VITVI|nr:Retrovirus-related Pol polyprotein from transposon RE2 [Vitis vinifera]